jgi:hypothetical protein
MDQDLLTVWRDGLKSARYVAARLGRVITLEGNLVSRLLILSETSLHISCSVLFL